MKTYPSKISLGIVLPISIILLSAAILMGFEKAWFGLAVILLVIAFVFHLFATTYYQLNDTTLKIKCGFFYNLSININTIKEIKETRSPLSAPALSLDRVIISYNKFDTVVISPKDKMGFIKDVVAIHPNIIVSLQQNPKQTIITA